MDETISIIVPVYNVKDYLERSVRSIAEQTYRNIEIILVDDGSKDGSGELTERLAEQDSRITVLHQPNGGVTRARLAGVAAAKGAWIGFVDADDLIEPDMYQRLYDNAVSYHADISHCGYQMVFPNRIDYYYNTGRLVEQDSLTGLKDLLAGKYIEPGLCNKLFHRNLFQDLLDNGGMDLSIKNMEDLLMNYLLFKHARLSIYEDFCPYHYLIRAGSAATSKINEHKLADPRKVFRRLLEETQDVPELQRIVTSRLAGNLIGISTMGNEGNQSLIAPHRKSARKELKSLRRELIDGPYSRKLKLQTRWATFWPASYRWAHLLYGRLTGHDKKYEI